MSSIDRVIGCLKGIAVGDAIGKQTETLSHYDVQRWYPHGVRGFEDEPGTVIRRYKGNSKREWRVGETTDDTERTIAVAKAIISDRDVRHTTVGREMLWCRKCIHPGVQSLWEFHQAGDPGRTTDRHDGCGAAVRVAPVGLFYRLDSFDELIRGAREASIPTHGGHLALAAARATAGAVSAAVEGGSGEHVLETAVRAVMASDDPRSSESDARFAEAVRTACDFLRTSDRSAREIAAEYFPDRPLTIVPLALALAGTRQSAEDAILLAANVGGDSDSVASIAGGLLGAMYPQSVNERWSGIVEMVNGHGLAALGGDLARLRAERQSARPREPA